MTTPTTAPARAGIAPAPQKVRGFIALTFALTWAPWLGALALGGDLDRPSSSSCT
ncbi:hypothetical protein [Occultella glacieicola]|uniref:hypothetical protein n=1 Tax=Occultella glacieicola TaxID=2518684 RepID=UPI0014046A7D|nr:hypothetical protein [Occultella glacieicola]